MSELIEAPDRVAEYETLLLARSGPVLTVAFNRPERKNALSWQMWMDLRAALHQAGADPSVRILVLTGSGGSFCAGADLVDKTTSLHPLVQMNTVHAVVEQLHRLAKITIARVDGDAIGAGCNLALACDFVFASERSRFAQIFVRRGLAVDCGGSWILPRLVGARLAKELCLTGRMLSAAEAAAIGLLTRCVPADDLDRQIDELVEELLLGAPNAQSLTKQLLHESNAVSLGVALEREATAQVVNLGAPDLREAVSAFRERRPAQFTGAWRAPRATDSPDR